MSCETPTLSVSSRWIVWGRPTGVDVLERVERSLKRLSAVKVREVARVLVVVRFRRNFDLRSGVRLSGFELGDCGRHIRSGFRGSGQWERGRVGEAARENVTRTRRRMANSGMLRGTRVPLRTSRVSCSSIPSSKYASQCCNDSPNFVQRRVMYHRDADDPVVLVDSDLIEQSDSVEVSVTDANLHLSLARERGGEREERTHLASFVEFVDNRLGSQRSTTSHDKAHSRCTSDFVECLGSHDLHSALPLRRRRQPVQQLLREQLFVVCHPLECLVELLALRAFNGRERREVGGDGDTARSELVGRASGREFVGIRR